MLQRSHRDSTVDQLRKNLLPLRRLTTEEIASIVNTLGNVSGDGVRRCRTGHPNRSSIVRIEVVSPSSEAALSDPIPPIAGRFAVAPTFADVSSPRRRRLNPACTGSHFPPVKNSRADCNDHSDLNAGLVGA